MICMSVGFIVASSLLKLKPKPKQRAKAENPRHYLSAHQPNPAFEGTRGYIFAHFSGSFRPRPSTRALGRNGRLTLGFGANTSRLTTAAKLGNTKAEGVDSYKNHAPCFPSRLSICK